jgi:hypothetical protein
VSATKTPVMPARSEAVRGRRDKCLSMVARAARKAITKARSTQATMSTSSASPVMSRAQVTSPSTFSCKSNPPDSSSLPRKVHDARSFPRPNPSIPAPVWSRCRKASTDWARRRLRFVKHAIALRWLREEGAPCGEPSKWPCFRPRPPSVFEGVDCVDWRRWRHSPNAKDRGTRQSFWRTLPTPGSAPPSKTEVIAQPQTARAVTHSTSSFFR